MKEHHLLLSLHSLHVNSHTRMPIDKKQVLVQHDVSEQTRCGARSTVLTVGVAAVHVVIRCYRRSQLRKYTHIILLDGTLFFLTARLEILHVCAR